jgi:hypothetical protein
VSISSPPCLFLVLRSRRSLCLGYVFIQGQRSDMTSRIFIRLAAKPFLTGGAVIGGVGAAGGFYANERNKKLTATAAEVQFHTSYGFVVDGIQTIEPPKDWKGRLFEIRNDYPKPGDAAATGLPPAPGPERPAPSLDPLKDARWLDIDFEKHPEEYCQVIKEYCFEGNVENEFVLQKNLIRPWYHAPWMHWSPHGREPLNGLTFERPTPPGELASTQGRTLQTWACGFYNWAGGCLCRNPLKLLTSFQAPRHSAKSGRIQTTRSGTSSSSQREPLCSRRVLPSPRRHGALIDFRQPDLDDRCE